MEDRKRGIVRLIEEIDGSICGIVGHISAIGNEEFPTSTHLILADLLTNVTELREELSPWRILEKSKCCNAEWNIRYESSKDTGYQLVCAKCNCPQGKQ